MNISINTKDGVAIYRQITNQIRYMVASGLLKGGEEISAVRALALTLNVTPNTVVKAYDELEAAGVIFKRRGAGTYISQEQSPLANRERLRIIESRIDALLAEAHQLDFSPQELLALIDKRQTALKSDTDSSKKG
ncbi:MAG: GntR family transcriptional regulator [SAR86 cluster bacterium]|uniref:GntR family transcriptional regulator n=1 Tax=SAR86 cluster bacterium TaxID=2030880 RepID=A0A2A5AEB4_9GAMM|nr:MAG: GntR family transcriptional regulator [SAR86 cluster bacterium]